MVIGFVFFIVECITWYFAFNIKYIYEFVLSMYLYKVLFVNLKLCKTISDLMNLCDKFIFLNYQEQAVWRRIVTPHNAPAA